ncbi:MAG: hypothetical protein AAF805_15075 [Planctomycetota bacterium]
MKALRFLPTVCAAMLAAALIGCGAADSAVNATAGDDHGHDHDHDHHDHHSDRPASLHAAVAQLTAMRDDIRDAIVDGEPDDAHGPLHEIGALLEAIPDIAAETDLPKEEWDAVNVAHEELFDAFGVIDKAFHTKDGDKKAAYDEVAERLDEAIEAIRSRLPLTGEDPAAGDHDHDHHDHDHDGDHDHNHDESGDGLTAGAQP